LVHGLQIQASTKVRWQVRDFADLGLQLIVVLLPVFGQDLLRALRHVWIIELQMELDQSVDADLFGDDDRVEDGSETRMVWYF
jgi:hypothetical protein